MVTVRIWNGKDGENHPGSPISGTSGDFPEIQIRDTDGQLHGYKLENKKLETNAQRSVNINLYSTKQIKNIWLLTRGTKPLNDAICFATVAWQASGNISPPSASDAGVVPGDILYLCGYAWNYSGKNWGGYSLRCGWLDGDSAGNTAYFININAGVMGNGNIKHLHGKNLCGLGVGVASGGSKARKRAIEGDITAHREAFGNRARVHSTLSAIALCDSPTSWGSSFYSIKEGIFCDMSTKTKYKICDKNATGPCFAYEKTLKRDGTSKIVLANPGARSFAKPQVFDAEYFTITDLNGAVIDDGTGI
ncbi:hypothetical protein DFQ27_007860 [Actinomortierella ambigua]|uniref:Uncharacterized protein n=1 Tax=Actinomortierella ambigua TaxID=1343610 RepID=A0A9P6PRY0_9FUNG|nr:hypothetical protein DFQ27_007860 [Actinomortierella ambigua]